MRIFHSSDLYFKQISLSPGYTAGDLAILIEKIVWDFDQFT